MNGDSKIVKFPRKLCLTHWGKSHIFDRDIAFKKILIAVLKSIRPVQDTFEKYLDTDTFKILSEKSI